MELNAFEISGISFAEVISDKVEIQSVQDAIDIMANCRYLEADSIILYEKNIAPAFFDLKTGLAGDILQKFSNYRMRLAIVGDFSGYKSKSLHAFILESNKNKNIVFVRDLETACKMLL